MMTGHRTVPATPESNLVVAVTGPTGTFGYGLLPLLQADPGIAHVVAFLITGTAGRATIRAVNVEGTLNAIRAAVCCG